MLGVWLTLKIPALGRLQQRIAIHLRLAWAAESQKEQEEEEQEEMEEDRAMAQW